MDEKSYCLHLHPVPNPSCYFQLQLLTFTYPLCEVTVFSGCRVSFFVMFLLVFSWVHSSLPTVINGTIVVVQILPVIEICPVQRCSWYKSPSSGVPISFMKIYSLLSGCFVFSSLSWADLLFWPYQYCVWLCARSWRHLFPSVFVFEVQSCAFRL